MPQQRVKVLHDDVCTQPPNLTDCHSMSLERLPNKCQVNYPHHLPTKYGSFVKIGPQYSEVFGVIHQFLPYCHKSCHFNSINSGVTGPNLTKFLRNAEKLMPFNLLKSKLRYCSPFRNASTMNEGMPPILCHKLVTMAKSLERLDIPGYQSLPSAYQCGKIGEDLVH